MNFEITKLDRRHAWHNQFPYMVEFRRRKTWDHKSSGGVLEFDQSRRWFNETYGWSQDIETREEMLKSLLQMDPKDCKEKLKSLYRTRILCQIQADRHIQTIV